MYCNMQKILSRRKETMKKRIVSTTIVSAISLLMVMETNALKAEENIYPIQCISNEVFFQNQNKSVWNPTINKTFLKDLEELVLTAEPIPMEVPTEEITEELTEEITEEPKEESTEEPVPTEEPTPEFVEYNYAEHPEDWPERYMYHKGEILTRRLGKVIGPSGAETYYSLPMQGVVDIMRSLGYNDPYWKRSDGVKMLGPYVMVAANLDIRPRGTILKTTLGWGIVCDTGEFAYKDPYQIDIAVSW